MRRVAVVMQALAIYLSLPAWADAASFNCNPYLARRACPETLICTEPNLSRLDDVMASLYQEARRRMSPALLTGFRDYQREWLARRDACGCTYDCLNDEYRSQIEALRRTINEMGR